MTPAYPAPIEDVKRALSLIQEVMAIRHVEEHARPEALEALEMKLSAALERTEDRYMFPVLRNAARRAVHRPETVPWALTDEELLSVYRATGRSTEFLGDLSIVTAPAKQVSLAAALAGRQQSTMREAYEKELRRRGLFKLSHE